MEECGKQLQSHHNPSHFGLETLFLEEEREKNASGTHRRICLAVNRLGSVCVCVFSSPSLFNAEYTFSRKRRCSVLAPKQLSWQLFLNEAVLSES